MSGGGEDGSFPPHYVVLFAALSLLLGSLARMLDFLPVPYTVVLLVVGVALGAIQRATQGLGAVGDTLTFVRDADPHLILHIFMPLLIFESAFSVNWQILKRTLAQAVALAVPGLLISTALTALVAKFVFPYGWSWPASLVLGATLSATDPVAVVALLKELGVSPRLGTLIEGESLLNDGTAIVVFDVFLEMVLGHEASAGGIIGTFARLSLGGPVLGLVAAWLSTAWLGRTYNDPLREVGITIFTAYLTFFIAEDVLKVSGVLALGTLGFWHAFTNHTSLSPSAEHSVHLVWEVLVDFANTVIFILTGVIIAMKVNVETFGWNDWGMLFALYALLHVIRGIAILVISVFMPRHHDAYDLNWKAGIVMTWGGLRGAVALVLGLVVHGSLHAKDPATADRILFFVGGIALLTLLVNATATGPLLQALGLTKETMAKMELRLAALRQLDAHTQSELVNIGKDKKYTGANFSEVYKLVVSQRYLKLRSRLQRNHEAFEKAVQLENQRISQATPSAKHRRSVYLCEQLLAQARERFLAALKATYWEFFEKGFVSREGVTVLMRTADEVKDHPDRTMDEWAVLMRQISQRKCTAAWQHRLCAANIPVLSKWAHNARVRAMKLQVDVANTFVEAHTKVAFRLAELASDPQTREKILSESRAQQEKARAHVRRVDGDDPHLLTQIRTKQAAFLGLRWRQHFLENLEHHGLLSETEVKPYFDIINESLKRLTIAPPRVPEPGPVDVLAGTRLFAGVPRDVVQRCVGDAMETTTLSGGKRAQFVAYKRGQHILRVNGECGRLFIVLRGWARVEAAQLDRPNYWSTGVTFGQLEAVSGCAAATDVVGESEEPVRVAVFRWADMAPIAEACKPLMDNIVELAAFQVSYLRTDLWSSAKCDFMRRIAKAAPHSRVKGYIRKITEGNTKYQLAEGDSIEVANVAILLHGTMKAQQRELRPLCALKGGESYTAVSDTAILIDIPMPKEQRMLDDGSSFESVVTRSMRISVIANSNGGGGAGSGSGAGAGAGAGSSVDVLSPIPSTRSLAQVAPEVADADADDVDDAVTAASNARHGCHISNSTSTSNSNSNRARASGDRPSLEAIHVPPAQYGISSDVTGSVSTPAIVTSTQAIKAAAAAGDSCPACKRVHSTGASGACPVRDPAKSLIDGAGAAVDKGDIPLECTRQRSCYCRKCLGKKQIPGGPGNTTGAAGAAADVWEVLTPQVSSQ